jgi:RNA polymerase sigma-70 factor (ECF subfamily)
MEGSRVFAIVWRMTGDRQMAEDLTQDCFLRAWQRLPSFTGEGPFGAWLRRIAINVVLDARRRAVRESIRDAEDPVRLPMSGVETSIDLERAIQVLPAGARTVFVLHDVEGFRHEEIAAMLGVTSGTSKAQLHRARALLRGELA